MTDPGWVYLLTQAKGVIARQVLLARPLFPRRLGIPSIVNVRGACSQRKMATGLRWMALLARFDCQGGRPCWKLNQSEANTAELDDFLALPKQIYQPDHLMQSEEEELALIEEQSPAEVLT